LNARSRQNSLIVYQHRGHWILEDWCYKFYCEQAKGEIDVNGGYERVWQKPGTEAQDRYLHATFKAARASMIFWAAISHDLSSQIIHIHQRQPEEC